MGTFAETVNVDYRLSFAGQGKQFPFSVCRKQVCRFPFSILRLQQTNEQTLVLQKQTDKRQTVRMISKTVNRLRKIAWAYVFRVHILKRQHVHT
jgi:hypothetical protein